MISFISNRPALKIGNYQVIEYDHAWLTEALCRAAKAADQEHFPYLADIQQAVMNYLETQCPLTLLNLEDLFQRVRIMLTQIGCQPIANELKPLSPPLSLSLLQIARDSNIDFELAFFNQLYTELLKLKKLGAERIHFSEFRDCAQWITKSDTWNPQCEIALRELQQYTSEWSAKQAC